MSRPVATHVQPQRSRPMKNFPPELIDCVLNDGLTHADLLVMRAVNKFFYHLLTPRIFRRVRFRDTWKSAAAFKELTRCQDLAQHMKEIIFQSINADEEGKEIYIAELQPDDGMVLILQSNRLNFLITAHRLPRRYATGSVLVHNGHRGTISLGFFQTEQAPESQISNTDIRPKFGVHTKYPSPKYYF